MATTLEKTECRKGEKGGQEAFIGRLPRQPSALIGGSRDAAVKEELQELRRRCRQNGVPDLSAGISTGASRHPRLHHRLRPHHRRRGESEEERGLLTRRLGAGGFACGRPFVSPLAATACQASLLGQCWCLEREAVWIPPPRRS